MITDTKFQNMKNMRSIENNGESKEELSWLLDNLVLDDDDARAGPPSKVWYYCFSFLFYLLI